MGVLEFSGGAKTPSVPIAKDRLKILLVSDRVCCCTPDKYEQLKKELYQTVSKYIEVTQENFEVQVTRANITIKLTGEKL